MREIVVVHALSSLAGEYRKILLQHLTKPNLEVHTLFRRVGRAVYLATGGRQNQVRPRNFAATEEKTSLCDACTHVWTHAIIYETISLIKTCVVVQHVDSSIHAENVCIFSSSKPNHEVYVWLAELNMERYFDAFLEDG